MNAIEDVIRELAAQSWPVLCLDTCSLFDIVRGFRLGKPQHARLAAQLIAEMNADPTRVRLFVTYLVWNEWQQNLSKERSEVEQHLKDLDRKLKEVRGICHLYGLEGRDPVVRFESVRLVESLFGTAEELLRRSFVLERDAACTERALDRVIHRGRPSYKNQIKDSIHWEHYLELSKKLVAAGHIGPRIFVSGDKAAFWKIGSSMHGEIHDDLEEEAKAAGLTFFGDLAYAISTI